MAEACALCAYSKRRLGSLIYSLSEVVIRQENSSNKMEYSEEYDAKLKFFCENRVEFTKKTYIDYGIFAVLTQKGIGLSPNSLPL